MVYVFLADGFEEIEALTPVDILRRGEVAVKTVGVGSKEITGSHGISVICDMCDTDFDFSDMDAVILPGGMPGTLNLEKSQTVQSALLFAYENGKIIGAICAAPSILGKNGFLKGKKATCFDGFEKYLYDADVVKCSAVRDGNIITACGAGAAHNFGFELLSVLKGEEISMSLKKSMKYTVGE